MSEKIGGAKGTEIDEQFQFMEKKTDIIYRLIEDVHFRTNEYLQPNPGKKEKKRKERLYSLPHHHIYN